MSTYNDGIGNHFLGNVTLSSGIPISDTPKNIMGTDLTTLLTNSGAKFRNLPSDANFDALSSCNIHFGANADTIDDRVMIVTGQTGGSGGTNLPPYSNILNDHRIHLHNDSGSTITAPVNIFNGGGTMVNQIFNQRSLGATNPNATIVDWLVRGFPVYWSGVSDGDSLALVTFNYNNVASLANYLELKFFYTGMLLNPHSSLVTNSNKYIVIVGSSLYRVGTSPDVYAYYRKARVDVRNEIFGRTNETYNFTCSNSTVPTKQWTKDFEVIKSGINYGKARNLLIGTGSYPLLIPVTINGTGGRQKWLPVCHYGSQDSSAYTLLMRN